jgi:hypothetical protein
VRVALVDICVILGALVSHLLEFGALRPLVAVRGSLRDGVAEMAEAVQRLLNRVVRRVVTRAGARKPVQRLLASVIFFSRTVVPYFCGL